MLLLIMNSNLIYKLCFTDRKLLVFNVYTSTFYPYCFFFDWLCPSSYTYIYYERKKNIYFSEALVLSSIAPFVV